ncbi:nuclease-related domain-containing protein [Streptomyces cinerochromogenes]|uniref:nuclease-related domain-containing protein n=1 Tax=Streptomyces cinerochromogenes TaxID=66422 RepID=UPI0033BCBEFF
MERVVSRILRRLSERDFWRKGLAGERQVGAELNRLRPHGQRAPHCVPLANKVDFDHLLIGPGEVFSAFHLRSVERLWGGAALARVITAP